jgi:sec-independent protein translocase protein TatA
MIEGLFQPTHLLLIFGIALLVFGPKKLPELGKGIGEGIRGFKSAMKAEEEKPSSTTNSSNDKAWPRIESWALHKNWWIFVCDSFARHYQRRGVFHSRRTKNLVPYFFEDPSLRGASCARSGFRQADFGHRQIKTAGSFQIGDGRGPL